MIKELREEKISSIEERNKYLETFRKKYNKKFGKQPASPKDVHRELLPSHNLEEILIEKRERILAKDLSFSYRNEIYQIEGNKIHRYRGKKIEIREKNGEIQLVQLDGEKLKYKKWKERANEPIKAIDVKELEVLWPTRKKKPGKHHPWR